ncbi:MAG: sigma-70 family RNA polymerase sigma factor [Sedimentisphaerales bacterium]|nr:sigma-70 family RNA polymerase sigma factor [Sedimentisphaerales bacterium]
MIEDRLLLYRFKRGDPDALRRIYEKYEVYLLTVGTALLNDIGFAEDVLHDSFVAFAESADRIKLEGNLRNFLATCMANRCRDLMRKRSRNIDSLEKANSLACEARGPELAAVCNEQLEKVARAIETLPYEQREVVVLHLTAGMMFKQIAGLQKTSINTVQSRYRYGIDKLRSILNGEISK